MPRSRLGCHISLEFKWSTQQTRLACLQDNGSSTSSELAAKHVPMNMIQAQLGHGSLTTTSRYLEHIQPQRLIDEMQKREPWKPEAS
jgi:integrase